jgi:hypothetical protein
MPGLSTRVVAALLGAAVATVLVPGRALHADDQPGTEQAGKPQPAPAGEAGKEEKKKVDEFAEAARLLAGPAGLPECVWLGRRVVSLMWSDDLDTARRHLEFYDRFGCPAAHVQEAFRCVIRQGNIDPKARDSLNSRVHGCWINPGLPPASSATASAPPASPQGTSSQ